MDSDKKTPALISILPEQRDLGTGRDAFNLPKDLPIWATFEHEGWIIGLRFLVTDGYPVLSELRVYPDDGNERLRVGGEWSNNLSDVPGTGLPAALVKNLALGKLEGMARAALADPNDPVWPGSRDAPSVSGHYARYSPDPAEHWLEWDDAVGRSGTDPAQTKQRRTPGRKPLADELLATVSYYYVEAYRGGHIIHQYVEKKMQEAGEHVPVAQWTLKARERDFLTELPKPGQKGGELTPKAIAVLREIGFLSDEDEQQEESK